MPRGRGGTSRGSKGRATSLLKTVLTSVPSKPSLPLCPETYYPIAHLSDSGLFLTYENYRKLFSHLGIPRPSGAGNSKIKTLHSTLRSWIETNAPRDSLRASSPRSDEDMNTSEPQPSTLPEQLLDRATLPATCTSFLPFLPPASSADVPHFPSGDASRMQPPAAHVNGQPLPTAVDRQPADLVTAQCFKLIAFMVKNQQLLLDQLVGLGKALTDNSTDPKVLQLFQAIQGVAKFIPEQTTMMLSLINDPRAQTITMSPSSTVPEAISGKQVQPNPRAKPLAHKSTQSHARYI